MKKIFCWNSELDLTPRGPSSKLAFIVCGQAPFLTSAGWLNKHFPIRVCSVCRWCKHWQHVGGITYPILSNVLHFPLSGFRILIWKACFVFPSLPQSSKNATFATSYYHFSCPLHQSAQPLSVTAHVLDLVQAPLQLLTISFLLNQDQLHYWAVMRLRGRAAKSQTSSFTLSFYSGESPFLPAHCRTYNPKIVTHMLETRLQRGMTAGTLANGHLKRNTNMYKRHFTPDRFQ